MVSGRAFIFLMYIPWGETFSLLLSHGHLSRSNIKVKYQGHNFQKNGHDAGAFLFQTHLVLSVLDLSNYWTNYVQTSQINSI